MNTSNFEYFVLFANMRTGSNLFENTINNFKSFECHGELFNPAFVGYPLKDSIVDISVSERDKDPFSALASLLEQVKNAMPGFRLFSDHDPRMIEFCLRDETCAKIVLTRNPLDSFVSHKIAMATDQWKLKDAHLRRKEKIEFRLDEFKEFLGDRNTYQDLISGTLKLSGQTSFNLDFDDLVHGEIFDGLAKFLGSDEEFQPLKRTTARQNPETLKEKVSNYEEMRLLLKELNVLDSRLVRQLEPDHISTRDKIVISNKFPLMHLPISELQQDPVAIWMESLGGSISSKNTNSKIEEWQSGNSKKFVLTYLAHPLERAYFAFNVTIVMKGFKGMNWIRDLLIEHYDLELVEGGFRTLEDLEKNGYSVDQHSKNFEKFLPYLKRNLKGQTRANVHSIWASQWARIESYREWAIPYHLITDRSKDRILKLIEDEIGVFPQKAEQIAEPSFPYTLKDVFRPSMNKLIREAYSDDFALFPFDDFKP